MTTTQPSHSTGRHERLGMLITGGAGFIGTNFVRHRLRDYPQERIVVLDALTYAGNRANLTDVEDRIVFVHGDIRDTPLVERLLREHELRTIVHFAAESHVDRSIEGPDAFIETNVTGTHSLLKAARSVWLSGSGVPHRFHHVSTDEVYGSLGPNDPPFTEEHQYQPNSPYSASKAASDHLVRAYHHTFGLEVATSNCSNNYGPYQFPEKLIPLMIVNVLHGKPLPIYGDGMNVRDWLYVEDHCMGISLVLGQGVAGEVYNIGGDNERTNIEIVQTLCDLIDCHFACQPGFIQKYPKAPPAQGMRSRDLMFFIKDRPGHDRRYAIDTRKSTTRIKYRPSIGFTNGLIKTLDWYFDNHTWWQSAVNRKCAQQAATDRVVAS